GKFLVVGRPQRQAPQRVGGFRGGDGNVVCQGVVIGEEWRQVRSESNPCSARQRRHVDQHIRRLFIGERQRIGQHQSSFGVGIANLDGQSLAAGKDVSGAEGVCGNRVLD